MQRKTMSNVVSLLKLDTKVVSYNMAFCGELQTPAYASAAAGIMAIEAGHAAVIREQLFLVSFANRQAQST
jgi:hypothetical protein